MELLKLKSKVIKLHDYAAFDVSEFIPDFTVNEDKLEKDIHRQLAVRGTKVEADVVSDGDVVEISSESKMAKFNKPSVMINVGKGLFDKALETALVGMKKGEKKEVAAFGGKASANITVNRIIHTILPELAESELKEIRKECINRQIDRLIDEDEDADIASAMLCLKVVENSEFVFDDAEKAWVEEMIEEKIADFDEEEILDVLRDIHFSTFKTAVIGCDMAEAEDDVLTEEDYEKYIEKHLAYDENLNYKDVMEDNPRIQFMINRYAEKYIEVIDRFVAEEFKKALNREY